MRPIIPGVEQLWTVPASRDALAISEPLLLKYATRLALPRRMQKRGPRYRRVYTTSDLAAISTALIADATAQGHRNRRPPTLTMALSRLA